MVGIGVGTAAAAAIEPIVEPGRQQAWTNAPNRVLPPALYAQLVAQGAMELGVGQGLGKREGFNEDQFNRLVYLAQRAPDLAIALELWRRGRIGEPLVDHALAKEQIDTRYWSAIKDLFSERLSPPVIALAIVRGIMTDPGFLPVGPPATEGKVRAFPVSTLDPLAEAQALGFDRDRLFVETAISGRPAPPNEAARAVFRSILERVDFDRAISEGDIRNEWAETLFEVAREILTANQYAELQLRGFLTPAERRANTDKHGMSTSDSDLLYNLLGRSIPVHQVTTGEARGGKFNSTAVTIPDAYKQSLQRGNLRPEYYELAYANRYSYPSAFFFRLLLTNGTLTAAEGEQAFLELGWSPKWAKLISEALAPTAAAAKGNPWVAKAEQQWWTAAHKAFVKQGVLRAVIEPVMLVFVTDLADRDAIFQWWTDERAVDAGTIP
jgi:hypothetical protein